MNDFEKFIETNRIEKKSLARYLNVSPSFITQLVQGKREVPADKLAYIKANEAWNTSMLDGILKKDNWIISNIVYNSEKHDQEALKNIGLRIDELANIKHLDYHQLAQRIGIDYTDLCVVISGQKPAKDSLLIKIVKAFPDINPYWLSTGKSSPFIKDVLPDMEIDNTPEKLADAEKQLKEKNFIIELQKDTITSLKKQAALLEEKIEETPRTEIIV